MRSLLWIAVALLMASPVLAQDDEGGGFFGGFSAADAEVPRADGGGGGGQRAAAPQSPHPVDQLDTILAKGGAPLSAAQKQAIQAKLDVQLEAMRQAQQPAMTQAQQQAAPSAPGSTSGNAAASGAGGQRGAGTSGQPASTGTSGAASAASSDATSGGTPAGASRGPGQFSAAGGGRGGGMGGAGGAGGFRGRNTDQSRRQEELFIANFLPVLTPEQTTVWRNFEKEQIRAHGGYPALKLALEDAGTPAAPEQEIQLQEAFRSYAERQRELRREAGPGGTPDAVKMKEAENLYLSALIKALNADQRKALIEWRRNTPPQPEAR